MSTNNPAFIRTLKKRKKRNPPQMGSELSNKEKLTKKKSVSCQPKGLKSDLNNKTKDFKCVKCVFSTVLSFKPLSKGHTARRRKWSEISLKLKLWSPKRVFDQEIHVSPQNCLMGLKKKGSNHDPQKHLVGMVNYVHMVQTDADIIPLIIDHRLKL